MDKERIRQSVERILALPRADRRAAIAKEAAGDAEFAAALEEALRDVTELTPGTPRADSGSAAGGAVWLAAESLVPGEEISNGDSRYRLSKRIPGGALGEVWLAEQLTPVKRLVAMKFIRDQKISAELIERFERERHVLASLDHPNIARYYEAGTHRDKPWFAMEFIEGDTIDEYCRRNALTVEERIRLVQQVARAVQYAHTHAVVHRDLKPSNIMVSNQGVPKLLDFGIAKLMRESRRVTLGSEPHTPDYASPEQLANRDSTTQTDVYALGIILYELLTDQLPYHVRTRVREMIRDLKAQEPPPPMSKALDEVEDDEEDAGATPMPPATPAGRSAPTPGPSGSDGTSSARRSGSRAGRRRRASRRLMDIARSRGTRPDKLIRKLQGNLDNIVLKAMRIEPMRRYSSPEALAADLENHLQGLPVEALPESAAARLSRALVRHRWWVAGSMVTMVAVVALLLATTLALRNDALEAERQRIEDQRSILRAGFDRVVQQLDEGSSRVQRDAADVRRLNETLVQMEADYTALSESGADDELTVRDWIETGEIRRRLAVLAYSPANRSAHAGQQDESTAWRAKSEEAARRALELATGRGSALRWSALQLLGRLARERGDAAFASGDCLHAEREYLDAASAFDQALRGVIPGALEEPALRRERLMVATKLADVAERAGRKEGLIAAREAVVSGYRDELKRSASALARIDLSIGLFRLGETRETVDGNPSDLSHRCFEESVEVLRPALDARAGAAVRRAAMEAMLYLADRLAVRAIYVPEPEDRAAEDRRRVGDLLVEAVEQAAIIAYRAPEDARAREDMLRLQQMLLPGVEPPAALAALETIRVVRLEPDARLAGQSAAVPAETADVIASAGSRAMRLAYSNRLAEEWRKSTGGEPPLGLPDEAQVATVVRDAWQLARSVAIGGEHDVSLNVEAMYCLALAADPRVSALLWPSDADRAAGAAESLALARSLRDRIEPKKGSLAGAITVAQFFADEQLKAVESNGADPGAPDKQP
jgi:serine/threonine protein kinase